MIDDTIETSLVAAVCVVCVFFALTVIYKIYRIQEQIDGYINSPEQQWIMTTIEKRNPQEDKPYGLKTKKD